MSSQLSNRFHKILLLLSLIGMTVSSPLLAESSRWSDKLVRGRY